jgi:hypothetical protein
MKLDIQEIIKDSIRQFFTPLTATWKAIQEEMKRQESKYSERSK